MLVGDGAALLDLSPHLDGGAAWAVLEAANVLNALSLNVVTLADDGSNKGSAEAAAVEEAVRGVEVRAGLGKGTRVAAPSTADYRKKAG